jgi:hypothetical protein
MLTLKFRQAAKRRLSGKQDAAITGVVMMLRRHDPLGPSLC